MALALTAAVCLTNCVQADGPTIAAKPGPIAASAPAETQPVVTSRTDPFLKLLRQAMEIHLPAEHPRLWVRKVIDWDRLGREAQKASDRGVREERMKYVEFWKRLAEAHDFGMTCSRAKVFEWKACQLLAGAHKPGKVLPYSDLGLPKDRACEYLLGEDLPRWAESLRLCAAGVLAADGNPRGMQVLLEAVRAAIEAPGRFAPMHEALRFACTDKALPLWADAARDSDARLRLVVVRQVEAVRSGRAIPILLGLLSDVDREVRTAAAMALMRRDFQEAAPVLMAKVRYELDGRIPSAHENAPVCLKLQRWGVSGVPWAKIEAVLTDKVWGNATHYWRTLALEVAGYCLAAGREKVALAFLKSAVSAGMKKIDALARLGSTHAPELTIAWHAAKILVSNGRAEGLDLIHKYIEVGQGNWGHAHGGLVALAAFLERPDVSQEHRRVAMAIAAKAAERRDELFQGYFNQALEVLGETGALVRVERHGKRLVAVEKIALPYRRRYCPPPVSRYMMAEIYRAKLRSLAVAARQEGIAVPPVWLAEYATRQRDAIGALTESANIALGHSARAALRGLAATQGDQAGAQPKGEPRALKPDLAKSFATLAGDTTFIVCIMGEDWALKAYLPRERRKMPLGEYRPTRCRHYRGPKIGKYIHPPAPAGPVSPLLPGNGKYSIDKVTDLVVTVTGGKLGREPSGYLEVSFSAFRAGGERYKQTGPVRLALRGPYP